MDAVAIKLDRISKSFEHQVKGQVYAAKNVSLDVEPGEFVTLLGPSGCGKTTTLRMIAGFGIPDSGRILIGGDDVTHTAVNARNIGFVFQNYALFPHLSIFENVAYGLRVRGQSEDTIRRAVGEVQNSRFGSTGGLGNRVRRNDYPRRSFTRRAVWRSHGLLRRRGRFAVSSFQLHDAPQRSGLFNDI